MERAGFFVNHSAPHRDCVLQDFVSNSDLFECVDAAGRKREIDRASANHVAFARITAAFVKIDLVTAPAEIGGEQSASESATDEDKFRAQSLLQHHALDVRIDVK